MTETDPMSESDSSSPLKTLFRTQFRFAMTGGIATAVDFGLYLFLVSYFLDPVPSNIISFGIAMCLNFCLQRIFVFELNRSLLDAFKLSMMVSLGGLLLSTGIVYGLNCLPAFAEHQWLVKLMATGVTFFYNFFLKRFAFEKRFI